MNLCKVRYPRLYTYAFDRSGNRTQQSLWLNGAAPTVTNYTYDGLGNCVSQIVSATAARNLLDLQPGLAVVLSETAGANTTRYVHSPRGIHAPKDSANA